MENNYLTLQTPELNGTTIPVSMDEFQQKVLPVTFYTALAAPLTQEHMYGDTKSEVSKAGNLPRRYS